MICWVTMHHARSIVIGAHALQAHLVLVHGVSALVRMDVAGEDDVNAVVVEQLLQVVLHTMFRAVGQHTVEERLCTKAVRKTLVTRMLWRLKKQMCAHGQAWHPRRCMVRNCTGRHAYLEVHGLAVVAGGAVVWLRQEQCKVSELPWRCMSCCVFMPSWWVRCQVSTVSAIGRSGSTSPKQGTLLPIWCVQTHTSRSEYCHVCRMQLVCSWPVIESQHSGCSERRPHAPRGS